MRKMREIKRVVYSIFDKWYQKSISRGIAPGSNECGSLSHCARFVFFLSPIDKTDSFS